VDEYELEIESLRRQLEHLREQEADPALIAEYEAELRNLAALYRAARATFDEGLREARLKRALDELGFGEWTIGNVYGFVYDASMEIVLGGRDLASMIDETDYAASLLAALEG
jgi:hypothetical protein